MDPNHPAFAGRIDPASRDVTRNGQLWDPNEPHGLLVAGTLAAAKDGYGMHGVAYDATILAFRTLQLCPDGSCARSHTSVDIARAIDLARENGARIINLSVGLGSNTPEAQAAIARAAQAGIVMVLSAHNSGLERPGPFVESSVTSGAGLLIVAGANDATGQLASFSNKAGPTAPQYLSALGVNVATVAAANNFDTVLSGGTSLSAPVISGAAALLASAFPNLTGRQIVEILLRSADDAGAAGVDPVFGSGILNLRRAFQPIGQTALAGSGLPVSGRSNGRNSPAMGDATPAIRGALILDGYSRAFTIDLAATISPAAQERPLAQAIAPPGLRRAAFAAKGVDVSITTERDLSGTHEIGFRLPGTDRSHAPGARLTAAMALSRLSATTAVAFGLSESSQGLQQRLSGAHGDVFLAARDPLAGTGFQANPAAALGVRQRLGPITLTLASESGEISIPAPSRPGAAPRYSVSSLTLERQIGPVRLIFGPSRLEEERTLLGGLFSELFSASGAVTYFLDVTAGVPFGGGWSGSTHYRRGRTRMEGSGGMVERGRFDSEAFALDLAKANALAPGDKFTFRVTQPLRIRTGGFDLRIPISFDYESRHVGYERDYANLTPEGRELDYELAYAIGFRGGHLGLNAYYRADPGHIEAARSDMGVAIRFTLDR